MIRVLLIGLGLYVGCIQMLWGQNTIATLEVDDFMEDNGTYPYSFINGERSILYKSHDPCLRISEHEFLSIFRPNEVRERQRKLVLYTALLEEVWTLDLELKDDESIFHCYVEGNDIILLSAKYETKFKHYQILVRKIDKVEGTEEAPNILLTLKARREEAFGFERSPDDSTFIIYSYLNLVSSQPVRYFMDFQQKNDSPGYRADRVTDVSYHIFDQSLNKVTADTLSLSPDIPKRTYIMGVWMDNSQRLYIAEVDKEQIFSVVQVDSRSNTSVRLQYENFPKFWRDEDLYNLHFPPLIGDQQKLFIPIITREREPRVGQQIEEIKVLCFDFEKEEVNQDRKIEVGPSLLVAVSKAREDWGQDPLEKFDEYLFQDILFTPQGGIMLILQRYEVEHTFNQLFTSFTGFYDFLPNGAPALLLEELLIFTFDPYGNLDKMYNVPTHQEVSVPIQVLGMHYSFYPDWENEKIYFLMHENEGERFHKPMRTYFRELDLSSGQVTERTQVFDHKRRYHFFSRPHTVWLNEHIVATMVHVTSSLSTKSFWVTIAR
ncbi:MAG: hypothetical protein AAF694_13420 [Bacteroidota bacterium]